MRAVSVPVALERLGAEIAQRTVPPYLLTVGSDGRPHAVVVAISGDGPLLRVPAGAKTRRNVTERPAVAVLWPPDEPGGYSLIVDGEGRVEEPPGGGDGDAAVAIEVTSAVLHRPGPSLDGAAASACGNDCVPLLSEGAT